MYEFSQAAKEIVEAGKALYQMGMVPATSGNFSARLANGDIAITVSGAHKGKLVESDIMLLDNMGKPRDDRRPSAETGLHVQIYNIFPDAGAVLHPHAMNAVLLSKRYSEFVVLRNYELLKAFPGVTTHNTSLNIPVFANDQDIPRLVKLIEPHLMHYQEAVAYIIAGHGFYTWGKDMESAMRHVEALDYLFACELAADRSNRE